jgi:hypothetical protein
MEKYRFDGKATVIQAICGRVVGRVNKLILVCLNIVRFWPKAAAGLINY